MEPPVHNSGVGFRYTNVLTKKSATPYLSLLQPQLLKNLRSCTLLISRFQACIHPWTYPFCIYIALFLANNFGLQWIINIQVRHRYTMTQFQNLYSGTTWPSWKFEHKQDQIIGHHWTKLRDRLFWKHIFWKLLPFVILQQIIWTEACNQQVANRTKTSLREPQ